MGKKDKKKNKVSGIQKTLAKTEKKLNAKQKKELAALGEDDIEKVIAQIEREEAGRQRVVEKVIEPPTRRVNFSLTAHPFKDELILLGGEFHNGKETFVYGDMFIYNIIKNEWKILKAPGAPPPRCGHQAVATSTNKGELWVFGGEFSSPSESQFYHYKDLWVFRMDSKKWEKIVAPGGPSARSGHRMTHCKKQLIVFGGFHDNLRDYKYFNDVHIFNLETYLWNKIELTGVAPSPRSGCMIFPTTDNKIVVYGGYSKEKIKKDVDKGQVHTDMFVLTPNKNDSSGLKWKWTFVKQTGVHVTPRCSASGILVQPNIAYVFGGVFDEEEDEEELNGTFYNDLLALDLEKYQWRTVSLCDKKEKTTSSRRRKTKEIEDNENEVDENNGTDSSDDMEIDSVEYPSTSQSATVNNNDSDDIFKVTIGPTPAASVAASSEVKKNIFIPSPRSNPGLAIKRNILYLYGGMFEDERREYTFNDLYSLDCRKLNEWKTIVADDVSKQAWYESESSDSEDDDEDSDHSDDSNDDIMDVN